MEAMLPLHTLMLTSLLASAPALFGVAGLHARKSPAGLHARPIGHWQHWNWQHSHIGNIFHPTPKNILRASLRNTPKFATLLIDLSARKDHRDAGESPRVGGRKKFPPPSLYKETTRHGHVEHIRR